MVDADLLAREVVSPGSEALLEISTVFGSEVLQPNGELDRKVLGALIFADEGARKQLEAITHPRIAQAGQDALAAFADRGESLAFYEAALIVEKNLHKGMDGLVVVAIPAALQLKRLQERDGIDEDEARERLAAQASLEEKLAAADFVIDNSGTEEQTEVQVLDLWKRLCDEAQTTSK